MSLWTAELFKKNFLCNNQMQEKGTTQKGKKRGEAVGRNDANMVEMGYY